MTEPAPVVWTDWPARRSPGRALLALALIGLSLLAVAAVDRWLVPLTCLLLGAGTAEFLLPTRFQVQAHAARVDRLLSHRLLLASQVERIEARGPDLLLHPRPRGRWRRPPLRLPSPPPAARAWVDRWPTTT